MKCSNCNKPILAGDPYFQRTYYPTCSEECADEIDKNIDRELKETKLAIKDYQDYAHGESDYTKMGSF